LSQASLWDSLSIATANLGASYNPGRCVSAAGSRNTNRHSWRR